MGARGLAVWAGVVLSLAVVQVAQAEAPPVRFTAADQAAARGALVTRADLAGAGWRGGATKPQLSGECGNFHPKQSDLLVTGAAEARYRNEGAGVFVTSSAVVFRTARMVAVDWKRTATHPGALSCPRQSLKVPGVTLVSATRTSFPRLGGPTIRYRLVFDVAA